MILPKSINVTTAWKQINKHNFFSPICQSVCNVVFVLCTVKFNVAINFCPLFSFCWFDVRGCIECVRWAGALWWLIREREIKFIGLFGDKGVMGEGACSACHQMATSGKWEQKIATPVTLDPSECHFSFFFFLFYKPFDLPIPQLEKEQPFDYICVGWPWDPGWLHLVS